MYIRVCVCVFAYSCVSMCIEKSVHIAAAAANTQKVGNYNKDSIELWNL